MFLKCVQPFIGGKFAFSRGHFHSERDVFDIKFIPNWQYLPVYISCIFWRAAVAFSCWQTKKKTVVRESYSRISGASCLHPSRKAKLLGYNDVPATHVIFVMIGLHYYLLYVQISKKCPRLYLILALNER